MLSPPLPPPVICLREMVANDVDLGRATIDIYLQAAGTAASVRRDHDVRPSIDRQRCLCCDRNRVARPEVDQRPLEPAVLDKQFVAAAARVGPCGRTMEHDRPVLDIGRF